MRSAVGLNMRLLAHVLEGIYKESSMVVLQSGDSTRCAASSLPSLVDVEISRVYQ